LIIDGRIRAWIEARRGSGVVAAFVGVPARSEVPLPRAPAMRTFATLAEARRWVACEARALGGVPVEWVGGAPAPGND
jgi:hypothetical protein